MPTNASSQLPLSLINKELNKEIDKEETSSLSLAQAVAAYLPEMLAAQLLLPAPAVPNETSSLVEPYHFEAVTMMVDVTGFTPLCEALARKGREGAEQVTALINGFFTPVLLQVQQQGGVIAKFGGDAFNAFFERQAGESWDGVLGRALHSAFTLQKLAHASQELRLSDGDEPAQVFRLYAKVGLGAGSILAFSVGKPSTHCDFQVAGNPFNQAAEAEHAAGKGEIIAHREFLAKAQNLQPYLTPGEWRNNCCVLLDFKAGLANRFPPLFDLASLPPTDRGLFLERAAAFVPKPIYERLKLGYAALPGEHRRVVSLFVNFRGFKWAEDTQAPAHFHAYYLAILEEVEHYRGQLNRISSGDKGDLLHIIFGAPVTYQEDEEQAVRCALSLQEIARRFDFIESQKIGLSSGFVFAGELGSPTRHEYTVMGDSVNLSARLMQAASDWSVLLDSETAQRLQGGFDFASPRFLSLKGKSNLIEVCEVVQSHDLINSGDAAADTSQALPPIYGREAELAVAHANFKLALQSQSRVLAVTGEPGIGKSLFLSHLAADWQKAGGQVCQISLLNYERGAFNVWVKWFNRLLGLDAKATPEARGAQLIQAIGALAPELAEWTPLWGELLDLKMPEPDWLHSLDRQLRRQQLARQTPKLIAAIAERQPLLLLADDFQWIDSASLELLDQVIPLLKQSALLVCLGYRPDQFPDLALLGSEQSQIVALQALAPEVCRELVRSSLGEKAAGQTEPERFISLLSEMTGGNPFFIQELVATVQAKGVPEAEIAATPLSYNLQSVIMARLDGLNSSLREVVLAAAVVGGEFSAEMLRPLLPSAITPQLQIEEEDQFSPLYQLCQLDLLRPIATNSPGFGYQFRHALLQQVAYDSLPFARRRVLHEEVGDYFANQTTLKAAESQLERLTYHYERSANDVKAVLYLNRSAERSARLFANQEAIKQYQVALQRAKRARTDTSPGVTELLVGLGDVYSQTANFPAALENYGQALEQTPASKALERSKLEQRRSEVLVRATRFSEALATIEQAENELAQPTRTPGQAKLVRAQLAELYSTILQRQAKFEAAIEWAERGLALLQGSAAKQPGAALVKVKLYQALAAAAAMLKQMERAQQALSRALRLSKAQQDPLTVSQLQMRLAILAGQREQLAKASVFFQAARPALAKTGARDRMAHLLLPGGQNFLYRGEYGPAQEWLEYGLKLAEEINAPYLICSGYYLLARVDKETGEWGRALERYAQSVAIAARYELWDRYAEFSSRQGELLAAQGHFAEAEALVQQAISSAEERKLPITRKLCYRILAEIYYNQGFFSRAAECLQQGEVTASLELVNCAEAVACLRLAEWWALSELNGKAEELDLSPAQKAEISQKAKKALSLLQLRGYGLFLPMAQRINGLILMVEQRPTLALAHFSGGLALARATSNLPETAQLLTWRSQLKLSMNRESSVRGVKQDLAKAAALLAYLGAPPGTISALTNQR